MSLLAALLHQNIYTSRYLIAWCLDVKMTLWVVYGLMNPLCTITNYKLIDNIVRCLAVVQNSFAKVPTIWKLTKLTKPWPWEADHRGRGAVQTREEVLYEGTAS